MSLIFSGPVVLPSPESSDDAGWNEACSDTCAKGTKPACHSSSPLLSSHHNWKLCCVCFPVTHTRSSSSPDLCVISLFYYIGRFLSFQIFLGESLCFPSIPSPFPSYNSLISILNSSLDYVTHWLHSCISPFCRLPHAFIHSFIHLSSPSLTDPCISSSIHLLFGSGPKETSV